MSDLATRTEPFFGRHTQLSQLQEIIAAEEGQAVVIVGHEGMGKTRLVNHLQTVLAHSAHLKCHPVRYEVDALDSADSILDRMWNDAFRAAKGHETSFDMTARRVRQWKAFLDAIKIGDLTFSLLDEPTRNTKERLLERFVRISSAMPDNHRAVFVVDPFDKLDSISASTWGILINSLPPRFKFVFPQRPEDILAQNNKLKRLDNVITLHLSEFGELEMEELIEFYAPRLSHITHLRNSLQKYSGHPYAVMAAIKMLSDGAPANLLPSDPSGIAAAQWKRVCSRGRTAVEIFKSYAILEFAAHDDVVSELCDISPSEVQEVRADPFIESLLITEDGLSHRIYHDIFYHQVRSAITPTEALTFHQRAVDALESLLKRSPDNISAAIHLPHHILQSGSAEQYVNAVVRLSGPVLIEHWQSEVGLLLLRNAQKYAVAGSENEWRLTGQIGVLLQRLGKSDEAVAYLKKAAESAAQAADKHMVASLLRHIGKCLRSQSRFDEARAIYEQCLTISLALQDTESQARDYSNLGTVLQRQGQWNEARRMHQLARDLNLSRPSLAAQQGLAVNYGCLGIIARQLGDLAEAEAMHRRSLEINRQLKNAQGVAVNCNNLGNLLFDAGRLDDAEAMFAESLEINSHLRHHEGIAISHLYLGRVFARRCATSNAQFHYRQALTRFKQLGNSHRIHEVEAAISALSTTQR